MPAVTVCLSTYPTITTQRLCCSGSAAGIVFGVHVTDPIVNFVYKYNRCVYYDVFRFFCCNRQQQHAVRVIYTANREDSSSIDVPQLVGGSWRCHPLPIVSPRTLLRISREATLSVHYYQVLRTRKRAKETHSSSVFGTQQLRQRSSSATTASN